MIKLLEQEPFQKATKRNEMLAYKHEGFWQCMDTWRIKKFQKKIKRKKYFEKKKYFNHRWFGLVGYHLAKKCLSLNWLVISLSTNKPLKKENLKK